jgi:hypothetical protein
MQKLLVYLQWLNLILVSNSESHKGRAVDWAGPQTAEWYSGLVKKLKALGTRPSEVVGSCVPPGKSASLSEPSFQRWELEVRRCTPPGCPDQRCSRTPCQTLG